ncbi:hypothetical protein [Kribbella sp. NPDC055071]
MGARSLLQSLVVGIAGAAVAVGGLGVADALPQRDAAAATAAAVAQPRPGSFQPITPQRVLTTQQSSAGKLKAGETRLITFPGQVVPPNATAVSINVTAIKGSKSGYLMVFPGGEPKPVSSAVSYTAGQIIANHATIKLGTSHKLAIFNSAGLVDVNIDVQGYYLPPVTGPTGFVAWAKVGVDGSVVDKFNLAGNVFVEHDAQPYFVTFVGVPAGVHAAIQVTPAFAPTSSTPVCNGTALVNGKFRVRCYSSDTGSPVDTEFSITIMG